MTSAVRDRRLALGLTQQEVAERLGMDRSQFNQIERGNRNVGARVAARLAAVLGGNPDDYRTWSERQPIEIAEELVRRLDAGELVSVDQLERFAGQMEETAVLCGRLAARLREGVSASRSGP